MCNHSTFHCYPCIRIPISPILWRVKRDSLNLLFLSIRMAYLSFYSPLLRELGQGSFRLTRSLPVWGSDIFFHGNLHDIWGKEGATRIWRRRRPRNADMYPHHGRPSGSQTGRTSTSGSWVMSFRFPVAASARSISRTTSTTIWSERSGPSPRVFDSLLASTLQKSPRSMLTVF